MIEQNSSPVCSVGFSINRVVGVTAAKNPNKIALEGNLMAYPASGGVVVCEMESNKTQVRGQRFFCANNSTINAGNVYGSLANAYLNMATNDCTTTRNKIQKDAFGCPIDREMMLPVEGADSNAGIASNSFETITSPSKLREKVRAISCISVSPNGRFLAVGEVGYQPRILIYSLAVNLKQTPIAVINSHSLGVLVLAFSPDLKCLCSLGLVNDGFINIWKLQNNSVILQARNKCSSVINQILWHGSYIITLGLRFIKIWQFELSKVKDLSIISPNKIADTLKGKNVHLGPWLNSNFVSPCILKEDELLLIATNNRLFVLKLFPNMATLIPISAPTFQFNYVLADPDTKKVWFASDDVPVRSLDFEDLVPLEKKEDTAVYPTNNLSLAFERTSLGNKVSSVTDDMPVVKLMNFNQLHLMYLTSKEEIIIRDKDNADNQRILALPLADNLCDLKETSLGEILLFSKTGSVKKLLEDDHTKVCELTCVKVSQEGPVQNYLTAADKYENYLAIGDKCGNLNIIETGKGGSPVVSLFKAHSTIINDITFLGSDNYDLIFSVSKDRMIQVFCKKKNTSSAWELLQTLPLHNGNILKVVVSCGKLYACSNDRTISVHGVLHEKTSIRLYQEKLIPTKSSPVNMKVFENDLLISTCDKNLWIYDKITLKLKRSQKLYNDKTHESLLAENFCIVKDFIIVAASDKSIRMFDYNHGKLISVLWGHLEPIVGMVSQERKLVSISIDGCLFEWSFEQEELPITASALPKDKIKKEHDDVSKSPLKVAHRIINTPTITPVSDSPRNTKKVGSCHSYASNNINSYESRCSQSKATPLLVKSKKKIEGDLSQVQNEALLSEPTSESKVEKLSNSVLQDTDSVLSSPLHNKSTGYYGKNNSAPSSIRTKPNNFVMTQEEGNFGEEDFVERFLAQINSAKVSLSKVKLSHSNRKRLMGSVNDLAISLKEDEYKGTGLSGPSKSDFSMAQESLLEKYSDKLLEILQKKMAN